MFNRLKLSAITNSIFKCASCQSILFTFEEVDQYLNYDSQNYNKLTSYISYVKDKNQLRYFMLSPQLMISTLLIKFQENLFTSHHPFLKMYLFEVLCTHCNMPIGIMPETVNENTIFMKDRLLIDIGKLSCCINNKNEIKRIIKMLDMRLVNKLEFMKKNQPSIKEQKAQRYLKTVQKKSEILLNQYATSPFQGFSNQIRCASYPSVALSMNNLQKFSKLSNFSRFTNPNQSSVNSYYQIGQPTVPKTSAQNQPMTFSKLFQNQQHLKNCDIRKNLNKQDKAQIMQNLHNLKIQLLSRSRNVNHKVQQQLNRIFKAIDRLQVDCKKTENRMGEQLLLLQKCITKIREKFLFQNKTNVTQ